MPLPPPPPPPPMAPPPVPEGTMKPRGPPPFLLAINNRSPDPDGDPRSPPPPSPPGPPPSGPGAPPPPGPPRGGLLAAIQNRGDSPLKMPPPPSSASPLESISSGTPTPPPPGGTSFTKQLDLPSATKVTDKTAKDSDDEGWSDDDADDGMRKKGMAPLVTLKSAVSKPPMHSKLPPARPGPPPGMSPAPEDARAAPPPLRGPPPPAPTAAKAPPKPAPVAPAAPKPAEAQKRQSVEVKDVKDGDVDDKEPDEPPKPTTERRRSSHREKPPTTPNTPPRSVAPATLESATKNEISQTAPASTKEAVPVLSKDTNDKVKKIMESLKDENSELRKKLEQAEAKLLLTKSAAGPSMIQGREAELGKELDTAYGRINILKEEKHTLEASIKALHARLGIAEGKIEAASKVHISNILSVDSLKRNEREQDLEKQLVKARKDKDKAIKLIILLVGKEKMGDFLKNHAGSPDILDEMVNNFGGGLALLDSSFHARAESPPRGVSPSPRGRAAGRNRFDSYEEGKLREGARNDVRKYQY